MANPTVVHSRHTYHERRAQPSYISPAGSSIRGQPGADASDVGKSAAAHSPPRRSAPTPGTLSDTRKGSRERVYFLASKKIILSGTVPELSSVCEANGGASMGAGMPAPGASGTTIGADSSPPG